MRYWWVNQNQTYRHEIDGGYLWSPKKNKNQARNQFYENMREVSPGDLIFSFKDTRIAAIGVAESYCYESPKPIEFGTTGSYWENIGWKVKVRFTPLANSIRPKDHIALLRPFLPNKYSPLQPNGNGLQSVYLAHVNSELANVLMNLIGAEVAPLLKAAQTVQPIAADDLDFSPSNRLKVRSIVIPPSVKPRNWHSCGHASDKVCSKSVLEESRHAAALLALITPYTSSLATASPGVMRQMKSDWTVKTVCSSPQVSITCLTEVLSGLRTTED